MDTDEEVKWENVLQDYIEFAIAVGLAKFHFRNELRALASHNEAEDAQVYLQELKALFLTHTPT
jgi:hypothetical protein